MAEFKLPDWRDRMATISQEWIDDERETKRRRARIDTSRVFMILIVVMLIIL